MTNNQSNELRDEVIDILRIPNNKAPIRSSIIQQIREQQADLLLTLIQDRERQARINEHELLQHQATVNLKSAKAVAGWSEVRVKQLKGDRS